MTSDDPDPASLLSRTGPAGLQVPLRVVVVSMHTSPLASPGAADAGGMNVVELSTARALGAAGHQVDLLTRRDCVDLPAVVQVSPGVRLFNLAAGPPHGIAKSEQEALIEPFRRAVTEWWRSNGAGVHLMHSHHWFSGVAALPVARSAGVPHLQSYHSVAAPLGAGLDAGEPPESSGRPEGERQVAEQSDRIVAVSEAEKATITERYGPPAHLITVVRPGVDPELFRPLALEERHWAWKGCYLFFAARLQPLKAPDLAIRTLAALPQGNRPRLVIAGETSADFAWYAQELHDLVDSLGLGHEVLYLGSQNRDQLARMMRGACVLLNPSRSETFGLINLEAAASGVPVIATRTGGMVESVVDQVTGLLLDSRDPQAWAEAVTTFTSSAERRARFALAGRQFAATRSWDVVASELADVYRQEITR